MLSYRHGFHAGNPADVLKHLVLSLTLEALGKKDKPFFVLETHAGAGAYDLQSDFAQKNREHEAGIGRVLKETSLPPGLETYVGAVRSFNPKGRLTVYPGAPLLIQRATRPQDRMVFSELHPAECKVLNHRVGDDPRISVLAQDGYSLLKSHLPPIERRGLVHIDPAYERSDETRQLIKGVAAGIRRWESGVFLIWYPILKRWSSERLVEDLCRLTDRPKLVAELMTDPSNDQGLRGSGVLIINPAWQVDQQLIGSLPWLADLFSSDGRGLGRVELLA